MSGPCQRLWMSRRSQRVTLALEAIHLLCRYPDGRVYRVHWSPEGLGVISEGLQVLRCDDGELAGDCLSFLARCQLSSPLVDAIRDRSTVLGHTDRIAESLPRDIFLFVVHGVRFEGDVQKLRDPGEGLLGIGHEVFIADVKVRHAVSLRNFAIAGMYRLRMGLKFSADLKSPSKKELA